MSTDLEKDKKEARQKIGAYVTTVETNVNSKILEKQSSVGDSFEKTKSEVQKSLNNLGDTKQRLQGEITSQFDTLIDLFKLSSLKTGNSGSNTIDYLLTQVLGAAQNTKSRIAEIFIEETLKTAGCSQEQTFESGVDGNKIYIRANQIDLFKLLKKDPNDDFNKLLYEYTNAVNGVHPYSMDKQLYNRLQNEGVSFFDEFGQDYIGGSNFQIMDIKYVTSYNIAGTTYYEDAFEISLSNRATGNNVSDFLRDYYSSIDLLDFNGLSVKIMNSIMGIIDIKGGLTTSEKEEQSKFEKLIQRILGLCFDSNREIDVSGAAKLSTLDNIDESFFEMSPLDLKNIENEVNNMLNGVTEFEDCGNIKLPVNVKTVTESLNKIRLVPDNRKINALKESLEEAAKDDNWKLQLPDGINIDIAIKGGVLKIIPQAVVSTILSPKVLLGMMIVFKSVGSTIMDEVEDFSTFMKNMKSFMVEFVSKVGAIFVEELFNLLKKNIRQLVEILIVEIVKESKNAQVKMISSILYALIQLASIAIDWRQCKSVIDEILKLLNLATSLSNTRLPKFALAASGLLGGYSPTRAMANLTENMQKLGLPTGDLPDGSPNQFMPAMRAMIDGQRDEQLANSKTEVFIPPLAVVSVGGGTTLPARGTGKTF